MPRSRCPVCEHRFPTADAVADHLSRGQSSCRPEMVDLIKVSDLLTLQDSKDDRDPEDDPDFGDSDDRNSEDDRNPPDNHNPSDDFAPDLPDVQMSSPSGDGAVMDAFPNASQVVGAGTTFMDAFDKDRFSEARKGNIGEQRESNVYYPFASKQDWELASWLLRSRLSMPAIDVFLSIELVIDLLLTYLAAT
jgi:hypothetical protein